MIDIIDTKNEVAWNNGFINWSDVEEKFKTNKLSVYDFNNLVDEVAERYSRDAERYYYDKGFDECRFESY
mgnify:CR=1 FL=1